MGLVRMVRPWDEWLIVWGYDINEPPPELDDEAATGIVHSLVGDDRSRSRSARPRCGATTRCTRRATARAACSAWATPSTGTRRATAWARTPRSRTPTTWPGSSRWCCAGRPARACSTRYEAERVPVGRQIVLRANQSIEEFGPIFQALGLHRHERPGGDGRAHARPRRRHARGGAPADRAQGGARAQGLRVQRPRRRARAALRVHRRGARRLAGARSTTRDRELYYHPTTWPGARLPHCWLGRGGHKVSTHDLAGKGRFAC